MVGADVGALAAERASTAIRDRAGSAFEVRAERAAVPRPVFGHPGPPALLPAGELLAGLSAAGTAPDLVFIQPAGGAPLAPVWDAQTMVAHGLLMSLEPYLGLDGRRLRMPDFLSGAVDALRWRGALHGVPTSARPLLLAYDPASFAAAGEPPPERQSGGLTWERVRDSAVRLVRDAEADGSAGQQGLLVAPQGIVLAQFLLARGVVLWDATGTEPQLRTPAAVEALRFWKALREPGKGTVPVAGSLAGARWEPDRIHAGSWRAAMGFTWSAPTGRSAAATSGVSLRLIEPPQATTRATTLYVDGFLAVPAATPDRSRSVQALAAVLDGLLPTLPWGTRDATPQVLATDAGIASMDEARRVIDVRRHAHATPLHLPSPLTVLHADVAEPVETGRQTPEEAAAAGDAGLARERAAVAVATASSVTAHATKGRVQ